MKRTLMILSDRFQQLNRRERVLLLLTLCAVIYLLWQVAINKPLKLNQQDLRYQIQTRQEQIHTLQDETKLLSSKAKLTPDIDSHLQQEQLQNELTKLDGNLALYTDQLTDPREISTLLEDLLQNQGGLKLLSMESHPAKPVLGLADNSLSQTAIYQQDIVLTFHGDYFSTLKYLRHIEEKGLGVFWDGIDYHVNDYPEATITLKVHTLGSEQG